jgi:oligopeptide transport system permease protein
VRGSVMVEKNRDYVAAAQLIGLPAPVIMLRHVLPNTMGPILVIATINLALAVITEATLSFLGVGLGGSIMSWGNDINQAQRDIRVHPQTLIWPSLALSITVFSFILLGEVVRDALDPKARALR